MENNYLIAVLFMSALLCAGAIAIQCSRGERVYTLREGGDVCVPCEEFTFMSDYNHSYRTCKQCTFIEDPDMEVLFSLCNKTHDSVILCTSGFYRRRARNDQQMDRCEKCTECEFPTRTCGGYYDTVCCHPNQEAVLTSGDVHVCREIPIVCRPGQFFSTSTEECLPCPAGNYMPAHKHTYKECLACELSRNTPTHAVIIRPCSRTAPTLFGCKDGYYRDPTQESLQTDVFCIPCRSCYRSLIECGMFHDAVCDSITTSSSPPGNDHEESSLEIGIEKGNETSGAVENTLQSTKNKSELPSYIECSGSGDVWICYFIIVILLLPSNLILLLILYKINQRISKADHIYVKPGTHLFCFISTVNKMRLFAMISIGAIILFQILAAVFERYAKGLLITIIIVFIVNVIIHGKYLFASIKKKQHITVVEITHSTEITEIKMLPHANTSEHRNSLCKDILE